MSSNSPSGGRGAPTRYTAFERNAAAAAVREKEECALRTKPNLLLVLAATASTEWQAGQARSKSYLTGTVATSDFRLREALKTVGSA